MFYQTLVLPGGLLFYGKTQPQKFMPQSHGSMG